MHISALQLPTLQLGSLYCRAPVLGWFETGADVVTLRQDLSARFVAVEAASEWMMVRKVAFAGVEQL